MRAVVLAGGLGRRLAPYTTVFPKPLVPIGEIPVIEIVLRQLRWYGIDEAIISVGYLAELIQAYFVTRGPIPGLEIRYVREAQPLGTAGAVRLVGERDDDLLVINGDIITTLDFSQLIEYHRQHRPALTIAVQPRAVQVDLGVLEVDEQAAVKAYIEKPTLQYLCSMGVYLYSPQAVAAIEPGERLDFPDLVTRLIHRGERVLSYQSDCYWLDIGRHVDYERAVADFPAMRHQLLPDEDR